MSELPSKLIIWQIDFLCVCEHFLRGPCGHEPEVVSSDSLAFQTAPFLSLHHLVYSWTGRQEVTSECPMACEGNEGTKVTVRSRRWLLHIVRASLRR